MVIYETISWTQRVYEDRMYQVNAVADIPIEAGHSIHKQLILIER